MRRFGLGLAGRHVLVAADHDGSIRRERCAYDPRANARGRGPRGSNRPERLDVPDDRARSIDERRHGRSQAGCISGSPASIPGTILAQDFDNGGESVAYHDTTPGNSGGAYRSTDVDLEPSTDGGNDVGWIAAGEWLNYTVNVSAAGSYVVTFRVASLGQGGTFHLEMNGVNVSGAITIPDTGSWQNWQSVGQTVTLQAGQQKARLVADSGGPAGPVGNINSIQFAPSAVMTPYSGTPAPIPGVI
ncbi:MAG: hypothetical protein DMG00_31010, partial [Acidobacteria bacterium]